VLAIASKTVYIVYMIKIEKNKNFKGHLNIFVGGFLFDQVKSRANAMKIASDLAVQREEKGYTFLGSPKLISHSEVLNQGK
tara:strand:- start:1036 stop:1278 length:243 start_codon:yes stop_codon:yes gene_type:complete